MIFFLSSCLLASQALAAGYVESNNQDIGGSVHVSDRLHLMNANRIQVHALQQHLEKREDPYFSPLTSEPWSNGMASSEQASEAPSVQNSPSAFGLGDDEKTPFHQFSEVPSNGSPQSQSWDDSEPGSMQAFEAPPIMSSQFDTKIQDGNSRDFAADGQIDNNLGENNFGTDLSDDSFSNKIQGGRDSEGDSTYAEDSDRNVETFGGNGFEAKDLDGVKEDGTAFKNDGVDAAFDSARPLEDQSGKGFFNGADREDISGDGFQDDNAGIEDLDGTDENNTGTGGLEVEDLNTSASGGEDFEGASFEGDDTDIDNFDTDSNVDLGGPEEGDFGIEGLDGNPIPGAKDVYTGTNEDESPNEDDLEIYKPNDSFDGDDFEGDSFEGNDTDIENVDTGVNFDGSDNDDFDTNNVNDNDLDGDIDADSNSDGSEEDGLETDDLDDKGFAGDSDDIDSSVAVDGSVQDDLDLGGEDLEGKSFGGDDADTNDEGVNLDGSDEDDFGTDGFDENDADSIEDVDVDTAVEIDGSSEGEFGNGDLDGEDFDGGSFESDDTDIKIKDVDFDSKAVSNGPAEGDFGTEDLDSNDDENFEGEGPEGDDTVIEDVDTDVTFPGSDIDDLGTDVLDEDGVEDVIPDTDVDVEGAEEDFGTDNFDAEKPIGEDFGGDGFEGDDTDIGDNGTDTIDDSDGPEEGDFGTEDLDGNEFDSGVDTEIGVDVGEDDFGTDNDDGEGFDGEDFEGDGFEGDDTDIEDNGTDTNNDSDGPEEDDFGTEDLDGNSFGGGVEDVDIDTGVDVDGSEEGDFDVETIGDSFGNRGFSGNGHPQHKPEAPGDAPWPSNSPEAHAAHGIMSFDTSSSDEKINEKEGGTLNTEGQTNAYKALSFDSSMAEINHKQLQDSAVKVKTTSCTPSCTVSTGSKTLVSNITMTTKGHVITKCSGDVVTFTKSICKPGSVVPQKIYQSSAVDQLSASARDKFVGNRSPSAAPIKKKPSITTIVVTSFTLPLEAASTFTTNGKTYSGTAGQTLTVTDCPCTLTKTVNVALAKTSQGKVPHSFDASLLKDSSEGIQVGLSIEDSTSSSSSNDESGKVASGHSASFYKSGSSSSKLRGNSDSSGNSESKAHSDVYAGVSDSSKTSKHSQSKDSSADSRSSRDSNGSTNSNSQSQSSSNASNDSPSLDSPNSLKSAANSESSASAELHASSDSSSSATDSRISKADRSIVKPSTLTGFSTGLHPESRNASKPNKQTHSLTISAKKGYVSTGFSNSSRLYQSTKFASKVSTAVSTDLDTYSKFKTSMGGDHVKVETSAISLASSTTLGRPAPAATHSKLDAHTRESVPKAPVVVVSTLTMSLTSDTTLTTNGNTYSGTAGQTITITDCPCTVSSPLSSKLPPTPRAKASVAQSVETSIQHPSATVMLPPADHLVTKSELVATYTAGLSEETMKEGANVSDRYIAVVSTVIIPCSYDTTISTNGKTFTGNAGETITVTDCPCTVTCLSGSQTAPTSGSRGIVDHPAASPMTARPVPAQPYATQRVISSDKPALIESGAAKTQKSQKVHETHAASKTAESYSTVGAFVGSATHKVSSAIGKTPCQSCTSFPVVKTLPPGMPAETPFSSSLQARPICPEIPVASYETTLEASHQNEPSKPGVFSKTIFTDSHSTSSIDRLRASKPKQPGFQSMHTGDAPLDKKQKASENAVKVPGKQAFIPKNEFGHPASSTVSANMAVRPTPAVTANGDEESLRLHDTTDLTAVEGVNKRGLKAVAAHTAAASGPSLEPLSEMEILENGISEDFEGDFDFPDDFADQLQDESSFDRAFANNFEDLENNSEQGVLSNSVDITSYTTMSKMITVVSNMTDFVTGSPVTNSNALQTSAELPPSLLPFSPEIVAPFGTPADAALKTDEVTFSNGSSRYGFGLKYIFAALFVVLLI